MLEMVVGGVCAHGATNLFRRGQYPLLEGLLAGVSAHGELQELAVGRGCLRDPLPRRDLASGIPGVRRDLASGIPVRPGGGSRKQTVVLRTTFFVAHPVPYANKFATVLSGHKKNDARWASSGLLSSGKRDSNPRPSAWEADALPTELLPQ